MLHELRKSKYYHEGVIRTLTSLQILQVLVFCAPFYDFLDQVRQRTVHSLKSDTPLVDAMIMFMREFKVLSSAESVASLQHMLNQQQLEQYGEPFAPEYVYDACLLYTSDAADVYSV